MSNPPSIGRPPWTVKPYAWKKAEKLADVLGMPLVAAMVLAGRGITDPGDARMFLDCSSPLPDPFLFGHMEAAVRTISDAITECRRVVVHGDYDADGITATALIVLGLRDLGIEAEWYLPSRFNEGYGLSRTAVEAIAAGGPAVLVTVDCGVNYPDEVALARERGLEVIVVDHHQPGPRLPECHLIHEVVGEYPHGDLCGVGLALKLMHGLHVSVSGAERDALPQQLHSLLDLVAIGTIADLAPLRGENRYYVREGLKLVGIGQRVGVRALASVAACTGIGDSGTVAFRLAPRLNAAGRLADPSPPLRLLLTEDEDQARALAATLHELNGARQDVERQILDEAVARVEALADMPPAIVLAGPSWHEGVVGIVASRLVERYHRPTILLGLREGVAKGSGRSIAAYDLMGALNACSAHLTVYGGHKHAVGLTLEADRVDVFRQAVEEHAGALLTESDLLPAYHADAVLRGEDIDADTALAFASLGPFGTGNARPRLLLVDACIQQPETTRNGAHLRCSVELDGVRARGIGFGLGDAASALRDDPCGRVLGVQFRVDKWQGTLRPEFLLERIGSTDKDEVSIAGACGSCRLLDPMEAATGSSPAPDRAKSTTALRMPASHDLRNSLARWSGVAQVLSSGERTAVLCCSAAHSLSAMQRHMPAGDLCGGAPACLARGCRLADKTRLAAARVVVLEWDVATDLTQLVGRLDHVIAIDPPFRPEHVLALSQAARAEVAIHLCYGDEERQVTTQLLRYLVHPRFAMVCLYRAMEEGDLGHWELFRRAAVLGWSEAGVVLTHADLAQAEGILIELGVERLSPGGAKPEARNTAAYALAEADYEECSRLCLTL